MLNINTIILYKKVLLFKGKSISRKFLFVLHKRIYNLHKGYQQNYKEYCILFRINTNKLKVFFKHRLLSMVLFILAIHNPVLAQDKNILRGYILDSTDSPIAHATLLLEPDRVLVSTDRKGYFETRKLYLGQYNYRISAMGFGTDTGRIILDNSSSTTYFRLKKQTHLIEEISVSEQLSKRPTLINPYQSSMPVTIIDRKVLDKLGSRRLDEVLREQTGIAIVNNTSGGNRSVGVQIQGLSSQYVMVLIDGQPILGRQSGNLDLSRIQVSNIERIEIIKGASSCLYGNDALGGAINIITRFGSNRPQIHLQAVYGSYDTGDFTIEGESNFNKDKGYALFSANYFTTSGFNNNKEYVSNGTTIPPYKNLAFQGKIRHLLKQEDEYLSLNVRTNTRQSKMVRQYLDENAIHDQQSEIDFNGVLGYNRGWGDHWKSLSSYYISRYHSDINVSFEGSGASLSSDRFAQGIHKIEQQASYHSEMLNLTLGALWQVEQMNFEKSFKARQQSSFGVYSLGSYRLHPWAILTGGLRFDHTVNYGSQLSPSFGVNVSLTEKFQWKTGVASGFKAPDFRTRYQVFYNPSANYYVVGNEVLGATINEMDERGELTEVRKQVLMQLLQPLDAEKNVSINSGVTYSKPNFGKVEFNVFYHKLNNQINSIQVATGQRNLAIYSFQNLPSAVNKGLELNFQSTPLPSLSISGGYQYLIAKDLSVLDSIGSKVWPYYQNLHDPKTGQSYSVTPKDYLGLENRSRHQMNLGVFYEIPKWDLSLNVRAVFRGKYPFMDLNGNRFIDRFDSFVDDHVIYYAGIEKKFQKIPLSLSVHMDNITDYINYMIPGQMGRMTTLGISYHIHKD